MIWPDLVSPLTHDDAMRALRKDLISYLFLLQLFDHVWVLQKVMTLSDLVSLSIQDGVIEAWRQQISYLFLLQLFADVWMPLKIMTLSDLVSLLIHGDVMESLRKEPIFSLFFQ